jgi:hypothetical protein
MPTKKKSTGSSRTTESLQAADLEACNTLIQQVGEALGITVDEEVDPSNVARYTAKFISAISSSPQVPRRTGALSGGSLDTFDDDLDDEIDRANSGRTTALQRSQPRGDASDADAEPAIQGLLDNIAYELGIDISGLSAQQSLSACYDELTRIKNPSSDVAADAAGPLTKGDSLAQAVAHNSKVRDELNRELAKSRAVIGRIAAAMQIGEWDADGSQLIERTQRWEFFKHTLSKRIKELLGLAKIRCDDMNQAIANELETHLATLMASSEFARWVKNKPRRSSDPSDPAWSASALPFGQFSEDDLKLLAGVVLSDIVVTEEHYLYEVFQKLLLSAAAGQEFVSLMNVGVMPILARLHPEIGVAAKRRFAEAAPAASP